MLAIDTLEAIQAGGTTQWIRIRGADTSNPVLLLIQQGPGLFRWDCERRCGLRRYGSWWLAVAGSAPGHRPGWLGLSFGCELLGVVH
jgi:hypothetical protein